eukprot:13561147-Ditylum_brightwellii.AAC.1
MPILQCTHTQAAQAVGSSYVNILMGWANPQGEEQPPTDYYCKPLQNKKRAAIALDTSRAPTPSPHQKDPSNKSSQNYSSQENPTP